MIIIRNLLIKLLTIYKLFFNFTYNRYILYKLINLNYIKVNLQKN